MNQHPLKIFFNLKNKADLLGKLTMRCIVRCCELVDRLYIYIFWNSSFFKLIVILQYIINYFLENPVGPIFEDHWISTITLAMPGNLPVVNKLVH